MIWEKEPNRVLSTFDSVEASEADKSVFNALTEGPSAEAYPHLARWYAHIAAVQGLITK